MALTIIECTTYLHRVGSQFVYYNDSFKRLHLFYYAKMPVKINHAITYFKAF